jgi:hypothetical protein
MYQKKCVGTHVRVQWHRWTCGFHKWCHWLVVPTASQENSASWNWHIKIICLETVKEIGHLVVVGAVSQYLGWSTFFQIVGVNLQTHNLSKPRKISSEKYRSRRHKNLHTFTPYCSFMTCGSFMYVLFLFSSSNRAVHKFLKSLGVILKF